MTLPYPPDPIQPPPGHVPYHHQAYPGAYPPPGYQPPPALVGPKKSMGTGKLLLIIGASLIGLCCVGGIAVTALGRAQKTAKTSATPPSASVDAAAPAPAAPNATPQQARSEQARSEHPKLGQPAHDGQFEFRVQRIECGKTTVGDRYLSKAAQGQFCLVTVDVKNIGKEPRTLDGGNQKATGPGGVKYQNDAAAEFYANKDAKTLLDNINPGNSVTGVLVFDIGKDAKISTLELHDSLFSGGVVVDVG
jgi:hypothetical protein